MSLKFYSRMLIAFLLLALFLFIKVTAKDVESLEFQFQDPVAAYNGQDISQKDFVDFLEMSANLTAVDFTEASEEILMEFLYSYAMYQEFPKKMQAKNSYESIEVQNALAILENYALADLYEQKVGELSIDELEGKAKAITDDLALPLSSLYFIAQKESYPRSKEIFAEESDTQDMMVERYQEIRVLADLSRELNLTDTEEYEKRYQWVVKNYLSDLYVTDYLQEQMDEKEMDTFFSNWLSQQQFFEYQAAHIYFEDETLAQEVLLKLKNKEISFEEAVTLYSKDLASNEYQGKMGQGSWVSFPQKDHPITQAIELLEVGAIADNVVKGIAGYHILRLDDKQETEGPYYIHEDRFKKEMWDHQKQEALFEQFKQENTIIRY